MMLSSDDINSPIKIIDFGLATTHNQEAGDAPMTAFAGSPFTVAPEVIKRRYGRECDLWSVGVVTYFLLTNLMPFNAESNEEIFKKIQSGRYRYPSRLEAGISEEAKDFISRLLVVNPKERMTAKQALSHPWIVKYHSRNSEKNRLETTKENDVRPTASNPKKAPMKQLSKTVVSPKTAKQQSVGRLATAA